MNNMIADLTRDQEIIASYALSELNKYWERMNAEAGHHIALTTDPALFGDDVEDPLWDDAYQIRIVRGEGAIVGSNDRSVLLGVYRLLTELGCRFYRPTAEGEYIPSVKLDQCTVQLTAKADNRHRGICIEGAASLEHVLDIVEWAPKVGFNAYFMQFRESFTFFERWYTHEGNDQLPSSTFTKAQAQAYVQQIVGEIKKRGMTYHAVGHGWTCEALGFPSSGWHKVEDDRIPEDKRQYLAEIGGKRTFFEGIPLNTQLCYANPEASRLLVDEIVNYIRSHAEIDVIHVWLGDNSNNFCECAECRKWSPPDHYVRIINEVDRQLTGLGLDNKIAFLIYLELLWTPETEKINNPDRFILMYAPIHRTYTQTFLKDGKAPDRDKVRRIPFELNRVKYPADIDSNLAFLYEWQREFQGDCFDFDYHLMWDVNREYTGVRLARVIYEDMKGLAELGLNGLVSCQLQRAFFPNGLCMYTMGQTLFDSSRTFAEIAEEYYAAAYGRHAGLAWTFLERLSQLFSHEYARNEVPMINPEVSARFRQAAELIDRTLPEIEWAAGAEADANRRRMLQLLGVWGHICREIADLMARKSAGEHKDGLLLEWQELKRFVNSRELELQSVLDVFYFNMINEGIISAEW